MADKQLMAGANTDDLDLLQLFDNIFSFFRRYGFLLIISALVGAGIGYLLYKTAKPLYASTMLLHSFTLTNTEHISIIDNWNDLLKNREYTALAERMHAEPETVRRLAKISAAEIQKLYIPNNPNGFVVEVLVKDPAILDKLQHGILYGLENSDYIKTKIASRRANLTQLIEKVNAEISKLDSTKRNIEATINGNVNRAGAFIVDVSSINAQMIGLNEKLLDYQEQLRFSNAVQVLHKFEKFHKPVSPRLFKSLVLGLIGGFAIGYVLALFSYARRKIRERKLSAL